MTAGTANFGGVNEDSEDLLEACFTGRAAKQIETVVEVAGHHLRPVRRAGLKLDQLCKLKRLYGNGLPHAEIATARWQVDGRRDMPKSLEHKVADLLLLSGYLIFTGRLLFLHGLQLKRSIEG